MIDYDIAGSGDSSPYDAVLLIHAGVADRRMWDPQWDALAARHRVIRVDLAGFGQSPVGPGEMSFADDVREVLAHVGADRIGLVASSFGGRVALEMASATSELVATLVLLCSDARGYEPTAAIRAFGEEEDALLEKGDVAAATALNVRTFVGPEADDSARELVRDMQQRAFEVQLAADEQPNPPQPVWVDVDPATITARTLVVSGALDLDYFQHIAADLVQRIPDAEDRALPWAGHLPSLERPAEVADLLLDFLG
ncbi:alpha/beta fold hydrolase [Luteipulveratus mongoliensis]|uniref:alpha/beta fold hydrolase n=1 Tax=Luteipulveratus mongoliensis TaxID=571913 RepID=UPI001FDEBAD3|nr:alpha/beta hydrolase [Luteipulveratus mongoliensis]